jgi:ubiquitin-protein ligase
MNNQVQTYNNSPTNIAINRIIFDRKAIESSLNELDIEGIYFNYDETSISTHYKKLIIGPIDSPYVGGFYFFKAQYPDQYPFYPMKMTTITQGGNIRKHPNLYTTGKCCFSFLGTWSGPPWTAVQNCKTVAFSIRSVLTPNPIENEPGWENRKDAQTEAYTRIINYFNLRYAVIDMWYNTPSGFDVFRPMMAKQFYKNYNEYIKNIHKFKDLDNKTLSCSPYNLSIKVEYDYVLTNLQKIYSEILIKYQNIINKVDNKKDSVVESNTDFIETKVNKIEVNTTNINTTDVNTTNVNTTNVNSSNVNTTEVTINNVNTEFELISTKRTPNTLASNLNVGYECKSENDGHIYKVIEVKTKNGISYKKWSKKK